MKTEKIVSALSALAQESRLAVYLLLLDHEDEQGMAAGDIAEALEVPSTTLSFHLTQLRHAGLVESKKEGRHIFYHANRKKAKKVAQVISGKRAVNEKRFEL